LSNFSPSNFSICWIFSWMYISSFFKKKRQLLVWSLQYTGHLKFVADKFMVTRSEGIQTWCWFFF
jgi:hypothetical protein